jgi:LCP family protein required for cell wall assembly
LSRHTDVDDTARNQPRRRRRRPEGRRPRYSLGQRAAAWTSVAVVAALVAGTLVAYVKYRSYWDSIQRVDVAGLVGRQPPKLNNAENILLIGSDTRTGQRGIGGSQGLTPGQRSDTLMLLHISPGHHRITVASIPRETMVPILSCPASDGTAGQQAAPGLELINAALDFGGPACTWKTFEAVTHIHVDHFVQLDFTGFEKIINDLGGVSVCLPVKVNDPLSGLNLPAGVHHVFGREALAFWRTRENLGDGSDLERITRDQYLMAGLVQGIVRSGLLTSPAKMLKVVGDATGAMATDTGLDQDAMLQIAESLRGVTAGSVHFITVPNVLWPPNVNDVMFEQPQAGKLFSTIQHDTVLPKAAKKATRPTARPVVEVAPSRVRVDVLNGSGGPLVAAQAGSDLASRGFDVVSTGDASTFGYTTSVIEYAAASDRPAVNTLKAQLSDVQVRHDPALTPGTVTLIIGSSFSALNAQPSSAPSSSPSSRASVSGLSQADGGITANTNICRDQAAFTGPGS